jgi:SAM-dependent methyltransferase
MSPLCESYVSREQLNHMEPFYPLHVFVCESCYLVQLDEYVSPDHIFTEYAYFSSYADSWVQHAGRYVDLVTERFGLNRASFVVELASNDGYLLKHFLPKGVPVLGIEPAANVAKVAVDLGVPTLVKFFGVETANELAAAGRHADLVAGNNVLAQVPDVNDFVGGIRVLLKPDGVVTIEFPHLMKLIEENQFDTIYHEHFSYFSFVTAEKIFEAHGMRLFDVEEIPTHGGSLRIYGCLAAARHALTERARALKAREIAAGMTTPEYYLNFTRQVEDTKWRLLEFLIDQRRQGKRIAGYGAPGKGNTLLNYCGIRTDLLEFTVDRNTYKQGKFLPGTHIPILHPDALSEAKPDVVLILPWNFKDEIMQQLAFIREWGGTFVVPIPRVTVFR